jgi:hypothetical protein
VVGMVPSVWHGLVDGLARYLMYRMGMWMVWKGAWSTEWAIVGTRCVAWKSGRLGKVPHVRNGIVDGLERCLEFGVGCGQYSVCSMGTWMTWKGTSCTEQDCGWFGKVSGVQYG